VNYVVDANLSPRLAVLLRDAGHDAVHVRDIGLRTASDDEIIDYAISADRIVISHDTDFGTLVAYRELSKPSFILIRSSDPVDVASNKLGDTSRYEPRPAGQRGGQAATSVSNRR
jgi:predicted nuclease of predicted toxin-antitoxin system